jgi:hypothetical protein
MSAIEMMDPKMDAGLLINQSKSKVKTVEDAIKVKKKIIKIPGKKVTFYNIKRMI